MATRLNKKIISLFFILSFISNYYAQKIVTYNGYKFKLKNNSYFLKDYKIWVKGSEIYNSKNIPVCGCSIEGKRNDSIFIKGYYKYTNNQLICTEIYYYGMTKYQDSIQRFFMQKKNTFELQKYYRYKKGEIIDQNLK